MAFLGGDYEYKLRTPFKVILFFIEFTAWFYLLAYVLYSKEFQVSKACLEAQPLLELLKSGNVTVTDIKQYQKLGNTFNSTMIGNLTLNFSNFQTCPQNYSSGG